MNAESEDRLLEALFSCEAIGEFIEKETYGSFCETLLLQLAVQKAVENIGECLGRVRREDSGLAAKVYELHRFVAIRNHIAREYNDVDLGIVWRVVTEEVPILAASISKVLSEHSG